MMGIVEELLPDEYPFERSDLIYKVKSPETNPKWGCDPRERPIEELIHYGVVPLDKPPNLNSHEVAAYVAKLLGLKRVAHGGTLDPHVSGMLPLALERATPIAGTWLTSDKIYVVVMHLHEDVPEERVKQVLAEFEGEIYQRPPIRSAVVRRTRVRRIYKIEFLEKVGKDVVFICHCEHGVYIRKLCVDVGDVLGCGAHMIELRRIKAGPFHERYARTLHDLVDAYMLWKEEGVEEPLRDVILPPECGILHLPRIIVNDGAVNAICYGAPVYAPGVVAFTQDLRKGSICAVLTVKGELVALAESAVDAEELRRMRKGQVTRKTRVLMPRDVYPRLWGQRSSQSSS